MTKPRRIVPGETYLVSRRTTQRQFLLRPDEVTNGIYLYLLAYCALEAKVRLIGFVAMSNHVHSCVEDPCGNIEEFYQLLHSLVARAMNLERRRFENLWSSERTSLVQLKSSADVLDKVAYTEANPAEAHLVKFAKDWPGATSAGRRAGMDDGVVRIVVKKPKRFFSDEMPDKLVLEIHKPNEFAELADEEWCAMLDREVHRREREAAKKRNCAKALGAKAARRQSPYSCPKTCAERFRLAPEVAAKNKWERIAALQVNAAFQAEYRAAYTRWRDGDHDVVFPFGTYKLRVQQGARCRGPDPIG